MVTGPSYIGLKIPVSDALCKVTLSFKSTKNREIFRSSPVGIMAVANPCETSDLRHSRRVGSVSKYRFLQTDRLLLIFLLLSSVTASY
jgi:hypothetical protein